MSSVRIEDEAFSCERYEDLAALAGLADADHARGKMARLWRQCTIEQTRVLTPLTITRVLGSRGVEALVGARLGEIVANGVRIRGTKGRIEWLKKLRSNGKYGKRGGRPRNNPQGLSKKPMRVSESPLSETPLTLTPALTLTPVLKIPDTEAGPSGLVVAAGTVRTRKPKAVYTGAEMASAFVVLEKLGAVSKTSYSGAQAHLKLIVGRLREGLTEMDLRRIVAYCADEWEAKPEMQKYLRPETLFGPETHAKYLDAARARYPQEST